MTIEEVSEKYKVSVSTLKTAFPRAQKTILNKYKVKIIKEGRGASATYSEEVIDDCRALTMYEETKDEAIVDRNSFKLVDWDFVVLLAIIMTPMLVFRGSFTDFLNYVEVPATKENILHLKKTLAILEEEEYISFKIDKTDSDWFIAGLYRKVEEELSVGIGMVRKCKRLAGENNKRSWIPLLKTWVGMQMAAAKQPFTYKELSELTGLSEYQLRESRKILERDAIFRTSKAYRAFSAGKTCLGTNVDFNAFHKENRTDKNNKQTDKK